MTRQYGQDERPAGVEHMVIVGSRIEFPAHQARCGCGWQGSWTVTRSAAWLQAERHIAAQEGTAGLPDARRGGR